MFTDHDFNTLKYSLPFWLQTNKTQFYSELERLIDSSSNLTEFQILDLFYTLHAIGIKGIWFRYFVKIFDLLSDLNKINLLKFVSTLVTEDSEIEELKKIYNNTMDNIVDENTLLEIAFLNRKFFKPLLSSHLKSMRSINPVLYKFIIDKCLNKLKSNEKKLFCLERLVHLRPLSNNEVEILENILRENPEFSGRIIDCMLRTNDKQLLGKAKKLIEEGGSNIYTSDNSVHYFEISDYWLKVFESETGNFLEAISDFLDISRLISPKTSEGIYNVANLLISSGYKYFNVSIEMIFVYCWNSLDWDGKKLVIEDFSNYNTEINCCYGFLINLLCLVGALTQKSFLVIERDVELREKAMNKMKEKYPLDHELWSDPSLVESTLLEYISGVSV